MIVIDMDGITVTAELGISQPTRSEPRPSRAGFRRASHDCQTPMQMWSRRKQDEGESCDRNRNQKLAHARVKSAGPTTRVRFRFSTMPAFPAPAPPNSALNHTAVKFAPINARRAVAGTPPAGNPWPCLLNAPNCSSINQAGLNESCVTGSLCLIMM